MKEEKTKFAARLRAAMRDARIDESGTVLMKRFNARYSGVSVTSQTVSGWLGGKSMPRQDKVRTLADVLDVDFAYLLTGKKPPGGVRETDASSWRERASAKEKSAIDTFLDLPIKHRELVSAMIEALAAASGLR